MRISDNKNQLCICDTEQSVKILVQKNMMQSFINIKIKHTVSFNEDKRKKFMQNILCDTMVGITT